MIDQALLYGIVDLGYVAAEDVSQVTQDLLAGGAGVIQLRAKGVEKALIEWMAREIQPFCKEAGIALIINDYPEIALRVSADGVHIGQDDGSLAAVREQVGDSMLVGRSTHSPEQAQAALEEGFDYIGFGPLFPTPTKQGRPGIGLEDVATVQATVGSKIPVFCIGGVKRDNLASVLDAGARRVVIVSDLLTAEDVTAATAEVVKQLELQNNL